MHSRLSKNLFGDKYQPDMNIRPKEETFKSESEVTIIAKANINSENPI